jgi:DNA-binding transcriptional regulator YdaS (Cro superfamily)
MANTQEHALIIAKQAVGNSRALAKMLGITAQALSQWKRVPHLRVLEVERLTGVPRQLLRPDLYPPAREAAE